MRPVVLLLVCFVFACGQSAAAPLNDADGDAGGADASSSNPDASTARGTSGDAATEAGASDEGGDADPASSGDAGTALGCLDGGPLGSSVLGQACPASCGSASTCCDPSFRQACRASGGFTEGCQALDRCGPILVGDVCHAPASPGPSQFACDYLSCDVGQVCTYTQPLTDGCSFHSCTALPPACAGALTVPICECVLANLNPPDKSTTCATDANGNPRLSAFH